VMVYADKLLAKNNVSTKLLVFMHDELNYSVKPEDLDKASKILSHSFEKVGDSLPIGCKMASTPKVGKNWYEIH
jgi:DNA polymerase I-like protein with 3'-5' exonuclease and polymerase domains